MEHEEQKQLVFPVLQFHLPIPHIDPAGLGVQTDLSHQQFGPGLLHPAGQLPVAGQVSVHPGHQYAGREGLFDVVVRAQSQTANLVDVLPAGGDHQDGDVGTLPELAADGKAVHPWKHQVQQDQVECPAAATGKAGGPICGDLHLIAVQLQVIPLNGGDVPIILHNQDLWHGVSLPP